MVSAKRQCFCFSVSIRCSVLLFVILLFVVKNADGCFGRKSFVKTDCSAFPDGATGCAGNTIQGKIEAHEITVKLYKNDRQDEKIEQINFLLLPLELSRIISVLIQGTENHQAQDGILQQIRCFNRKFTNSLLETVLIKNDEEYMGREQLKEINLRKGKSTKMISLSRRMLVDKGLKASENFTKESYCWYNVPIHQEDFSKAHTTMVLINKWANDMNSRSVKALSDQTRTLKGRKPLLTDPVNIKMGKVILVSSVYLRPAWASKLFSSAHTIGNQTFMTQTKAEDPKAPERSMIVPMMVTAGKFAFLEKPQFSAVSIPLDENTPSGNFIIILPKEKTSIKEAEDVMIESGSKIQALIEELHSLDSKIVKVKVPKMTIQVTHEWSAPAKRSLKAITNGTGFGLSGDDICVFQDGVLELTENSKEKLPFESLKAEIEFTVNRPFLFLVEIDHEILALGRIKDPKWCKFCVKEINTTVPTNGSATATTQLVPITTTAAKGFFARIFG